MIRPLAVNPLIIFQLCSTTRDTTFRLGCNLLLRVINNEFVVLKLSAWGKRRRKNSPTVHREHNTIDSAKKLLLHYKRIIKFNWQTGHCTECTTAALQSLSLLLAYCFCSLSKSFWYYIGSRLGIGQYQMGIVPKKYMESVPKRNLFLFLL